MISISEPIIAFLTLLLVWTIVSILAKLFHFKEKYGLTIYPLILIYESETFTKFINKQSQKNVNFWKKYSKISGLSTLALAFIAIAYFGLNAYFLLKEKLIVTSTGVAVGTPVVPIIPFITIPWNFFAIFLIASALSIIPHEFAHGVVAVNEGVKIKSTGIFVLFGLILGGYVKLDEEFEKDFEKLFEEKTEKSVRRDISRKLYKIAGAGLLANILMAIIFFGAIGGLYEKGGVLILSVEEGSPAFKAGLKTNDVILQIGNDSIRSVSDLQKVLSKYSPNETVLVYTDRGVFNLTFGSNPANDSRAYMGISIWDYYKFKMGKLDKNTELMLYLMLNIIFILQITIMLLNALPLYITDGAKAILAYLISKNINPQTALKFYNLINIIGLTMLALNISISLPLLG